MIGRTRGDAVALFLRIEEEGVRHRNRVSPFCDFF